MFRKRLDTGRTASIVFAFFITMQSSSCLRILRGQVRVLNDGLPLQHLSDLTFICWLASVVEFELVATATHAEYLKAVDLWNEARSWLDVLIEMLV